LSFTALLTNADAATFNLLRRSWFIPSDNIGRIVDRTASARSKWLGAAYGDNDVVNCLAGCGGVRLVFWVGLT
jgi:hypothetical protein